MSHIGDNGKHGYGRYVIIDHLNGWTTWYAHLEEAHVYVGQDVVRGQCIAGAGNTGNSTGPHLHLTMQNVELGFSGYVLPDVVNPLLYLRRE